MKKDRLRAFDNYEVQPSDDVWKRIEKNLPVKRKRRRFLFWLIPALLLIGVSAGLALRNDSSDNKNIVLSPEKFSHPSIQKPSVEQSSVTIDNTKEKIDNHTITTTSSKTNTLSLTASVKKTSPEKKTKVPQAVRSSFVQQNSSTAEQQITPVKSTPEESSTLLSSSEFLLPAKSISYELKEDQVDIAIADRKNERKISRSVSKWSAFAEFGLAITNIYPSTTMNENGRVTNTKINNKMYGAGMAYDLSSRFRISLGFALNTKGSYQNSEYTIILNGQPTDPTTTYSILTDNGNISGSGSEFNIAVLNSPDSNLFPVSPYAGVNSTSPQTKNLRIKSEFHFLEIPLSIVYKFREGKITPYVGAIFSAGYLLSQDVYINDKRIGYNYENGINDFHYSVGAIAGLELSISKTMSVYAGGYYREGLTSITRGDQPYNPYVAGGEGGIRYRFLNCANFSK